MESLFRHRALAVAAMALAWAPAGPAVAQDHGSRFLDRLFATMDADGSGAISAAEGEAAAVKMFERRDANGDGSLSEAEFRSHKSRGQASAERAQKLADFKVRRFAAADRNGDGRVAAEEFFAAAQERFSATDHNRDGQVTWDEIVSRRKQL